MRLLFLFLFLVQSAVAQDLVIVSPHWEGIRYEFEAGFAKWRSLKSLAPVKLSWRDVGGTSDIVRFIQSEYQGVDKSDTSGKSGIGVDIVFGGGIDPFVSFKKSGYLEKLEINSEILDRVAKEVSGMPLYDPDGYWFSPTMAAFGIFCNQKVLKVLALSQPNSWEDLLDPKMSGWIVSADPRRSGSAHMFYEIILQAYGWEKGWEVLRGLAANYRVFLSNSSQAILDVVNGEVACSFAIDSQANSQINRNPDGEFQFSVPTEKSLFNGDAIAVLRGAPQLEAAKSFVEFSLSADAQKLLFLSKGSPGGPIKYELHRLPVLPEFFEGEINPFKNANSTKFTFNNELSSKRWEALNDLLGEFLVELKDNGSEALFACKDFLPSEAELSELLEKDSWSNPIERNQILSMWRARVSQCSGSGVTLWELVPMVVILLLSFAVWRRRRKS